MIGLIFIGSIFITGISGSSEPQPETEEPQPEEKVAVEEKKITEEPQEESEDQTETEPPDQDIEKIEFYLDGPKDSGLFLGETAVGIKREDMQNIYGQQFAGSGFEYNIDLGDVELEPGLHTLFVYAITDQGDHDYTIKEITVQGNTPETDVSINVDNPQNLSIIRPEELAIQGWALDQEATDSTGVQNVYVYVDGPLDMGINLGDAQYGSIARSDVAEVFGTQFSNCGFNVAWDVTEYRPNEKHYLYIYAQKNDGSWQKTITETYIYDPDFKSNIFLQIDNYIEDFTINPGEAISIKGSSFYINNPDRFFAGQEFGNKQVAFVSDRDGGDFDLYISNLDGSNLTQLTNNGVDELYPSVSPDGSQISFTSEVNGLWQIFVINTDGSGLRQITNSNTLNAYSTWSHDGQYLFYESREGDMWEVYRIGIDGSNPQRLTFNTESHDWHPDGHPFRPLLLFESGTKEDIKIMDYNGENVHYITKDQQRNRVPAFSPDGRTIVFSKYLGSSGEVYIMDITGEILAQITATGATNTHPAFSPDGNYIGFDSDSSGREQVYIYSFADGSIFNVFNDPEANYKDPSFLFN